MAGLLSYTFLRETGASDVVVPPVVDPSNFTPTPSPNP